MRRMVPAPRRAQNKSACVSLSTVTRVPLCKIIVMLFSESNVRPYVRAGNPIPPPSVWPETPTQHPHQQKEREPIYIIYSSCEYTKNICRPVGHSPAATVKLWAAINTPKTYRYQILCPYRLRKWTPVASIRFSRWAPAPIRAVRLTGSTCVLFRRLTSITIHWSHTLHPAYECPPLRIDNVTLYNCGGHTPTQNRQQ